MRVDPLIGQTLDGRYKILSHLGEGGMGSVYKAEHIAMAQPVAIKVLLTESASDPSMVKRFVREARACFRIDHPNCVRVTDFGASPSGELFFAMEYLDGRTMGLDLHVDGPMKSGRVRHIAAQIARALHHAHGLGLIHRDLKPANIMLLARDGDPDFVKVFDFGLGKLVDEGAQLTGLTMSPLTQKGIVFGTPEYMSPEQARGEPLTPASDIYTLGVCCYEMLTGFVPFQGKTFTEILSKHVTQRPQPPSERVPALHIDPDLEALVLRCMSKDAKERPSAEELAERMEAPQAAGTPAVKSADTLLVSEASMASIGSPAVAPAPSDGPGSRPRVSSEEFLHPKPRVALYILVPIALLAVLLFIMLRGAPNEDSHVPSPRQQASTPIDAGAPAIDASIARPPDAGTIQPPDPIDAGPPSAEKQRQPTSEAIPDKHLEAAEEAYRTGNVLKQLAEANASLKRHRKSRRAAFLVGDALLKSGDKVAACKFFSRAGKKHYRAAGCSN